MKKRWISAIVAGCMAVSVLAGCDGKKKTANEAKPYEITWYNWATPGADDELVISEVNKLLKEKINATLKYYPVRSSEYGEKIKMLISANEKFDMCFISEPTGFTNYAANGAFMPLDELLKSKGQGILELIPEDIWDAVKVDGKVYASVILKDWATEPIIRYNADFAEEHGIDVSNVKKLEDLSPILAKVKEIDPTMMPMLIRGNAPLFRMLNFEPISGTPVGAFKIGEYDKVINQYDTPEAKEHFKLMRDWYLKGYFRKDAATASNDNEYFTSGKFFGNYGESLPYMEQQLNVDATVKRNFIYGMKDITLTTSSIQGSLQAISRNSENPEKTMEFMNLLFTDAEVKNLITQGIEGNHYVIKDGLRCLPDGVSSGTDTGYYPSNEFCVGNRFLSTPQEGYEMDVWEKYEEFNNNALKSGALGFVFDTTGLTMEIAAMQNVYQEYMPSILVGAVDPDEYLPKAMAKFRDAGMDKVLAELQRQYDEWKSNK